MKSRTSTLLHFVLCFILSPSSLLPVSRWLSSSDQAAQPIIAMALAALVNVTIDDTSSLIAYSPPDSWRSSSEACKTCLEPDKRLAYAWTWHDGTHIIPTRDADDLDGSDPDSQARKKLVNAKKVDGRSEADGRLNLRKRRSPPSNLRGRSAKRQRTEPDDPFFTTQLDSDDAGFVDTPVLAQFNFTGSAVYVFAIMPAFVGVANSTPTLVNLTCTLDSQPAGRFIHSGPSTASVTNSSAYDTAVPVFVKTGLHDGPHTLTLNVGPDSVFLLDYIVYSQQLNVDAVQQDAGKANATNASALLPTNPASKPVSSPSAALSQSSSTSSSGSSSHSVATFAGAVGGSVGLLGFLALSLALSLYRRRTLARRRDRAYRESQRETASLSESFHTEASEDGPPMQGPAPFVPRYFPGTVINTAPPPYSPPADSSMMQSTSLLGTPETPMPSMLWSSRRLGSGSDSDSYAEHPPPTPPLGFVADPEDGFFAPPPSFPVAISTPVPAILAGLSGLVSAPQSPSPRPESPVVPLLAPPPSGRPLNPPPSEAPPVAGPSGTQGQPSWTASASETSLHSITITSPIPHSRASIVSMRQLASEAPPTSPNTPVVIHQTLDVESSQEERDAQTPQEGEGDEESGSQHTHN